MKKRVISKSIPVIYLLASGFLSGPVQADWGSIEPYRGYNSGYGDFPPLDIDKRLSKIDETKQASTQAETQASTQADIQVNAQTNQANNTPTGTASTQPPANQAQNVSGQYYQQPAYRGYYQYPYAQPGMQRYNRGSSFTGPWNNNRSSYSGPWNNNRGSGFSMPWGNNNSGFRPWGNGGGFSW